MKKQHFIFYFSFEHGGISFEQDFGKKTFLELEHAELGVLLGLLSTGMTHQVVRPVLLSNDRAGVVRVLAAQHVFTDFEQFNGITIPNYLPVGSRLDT